MSFGKIIKELRKEADLTQEQLAELLSISAQAVSRWETDSSMPDIALIPALCNLFEISSDELLEIDLHTTKIKIEHILTQVEIACEKGEHKIALDMITDGLKLYPNDYSLMYHYAAEIFTHGYLAEDRTAQEEKAVTYIDKILERCTDSKIRNCAAELACVWFPKIGRITEAERIAESYPDFTSKELLISVCRGRKRFEITRDSIVRNFTYSIGYLPFFASDNCEFISVAEQIAICEKMIRLYEVFFENGDYLYFAQDVEIACSMLARLYLSISDRAKSLHSLESAARYAVMFDTYDPAAKHTSGVLRGMETCGRNRFDTHNRSFALKERLLSEKCFTVLLNDPQFIAIIEDLNKTAE